MSLISPFATRPLPACRRLRAGDLCWFKCPLYAFIRENFPVPVTRNRFFAPLWLLILGTALTPPEKDVRGNCTAQRGSLTSSSALAASWCALVVAAPSFHRGPPVASPAAR